MYKFFSIDVESVGLYGEGYAIAGGIYEDGQAISEFCFSCPIDECCGSDGDRKWVKENVPEIEITHTGPVEMRNAFWAKWQEAKASGAILVADCLYPVEASFLIACVNDDIENRKWEGPYPFMEIASYLAAANMDPMAKYDRLENELPVHNPLGDARQSVRLLFEALGKLK